MKLTGYISANHMEAMETGVLPDDERRIFGPRYSVLQIGPRTMPIRDDQREFNTGDIVTVEITKVET